jgi:hypothetical protein
LRQERLPFERYLDLMEREARAEARRGRYRLVASRAA